MPLLSGIYSIMSMKQLASPAKLGEIEKGAFFGSYREINSLGWHF